MSKTVQQVYTTNPTTTVADTDLIYMVQSPYTPGTDTAILGSDLKAALGVGNVNPGLINQLGWYAGTGSTISGLSTLASGTLITSAGGVPSISQTLPSAVQGNITSLGTISSGVWNGSIIGGTYGGTGINNGASTITIGGNFAMSGAFTFAGTLTGNTAVTFPTSGTLATTTGTISNATNIGITDDNATNATMLPVWVTTNTGFLPAKVSSTKITFNPSTATLTTTTFVGALTGNATTANTATNATNTAITDDTTTNATMFLTWVTANTGNLPQKVTSTKLSFNPSTGALSSTSFVGSLAASNITGTLGSDHGGTGIANASGSTITLGGALTFSGAFTTAFTVTGNTSVTLPTSGTLVTTSQIPALPLALASGGTHADLSGTGGTSQVLRQSTVGANITVSQLAAFDLSNGTTGSGAVALATSPTFTTPVLGTPTSGSLSNCTGYPVANLTGLGTGIATWLATPSSANLGSALTDKTGTGVNVFATSPSLVTPVLGVASATSINFGGSTLSTYTESSFTPTLVSSGGGTASYTTQTGTYTQIGNRIFFDLIVQTSAITSLTAGNLTISGLPATIGISTCASVLVSNLGATAVTDIEAQLIAGSTSVTLFRYATGTATQLTKTDITATSFFMVSGHYRI